MTISLFFSAVNGGNSPGISPSPSPRSSLGSTGTNSPNSSTSSLHKVGEKSGTVTRRTKTSVSTPSSGRAPAGGERSNMPPPTPARSTSNRPSTGSAQVSSNYVQFISGFDLNQIKNIFLLPEKFPGSM